MTPASSWHENDILDREELAERLKVPVSVTYRLALPHLAAGKSYRFRWGDCLDALREQPRVSATPAASTRRAGSSSTGRGAVFSMPHRAGARDAEGHHRLTMRQSAAGSGARPEGHP